MHLKCSSTRIWPPYVDFSIWGPYNSRLGKKLVHAAYEWNFATQTYKLIELPGPTDFEHYRRAWRVFRTAMLLLGSADAEHLDGYLEKIRGFVEAYAPRCWFIIYQGDVRLRSEELERMRRVAAAKVVAAKIVGERAENAGKRIVVIIPSFGERYLSTLLFQNLWDEASAMKAE